MSVAWIIAPTQQVGGLVEVADELGYTKKFVTLAQGEVPAEAYAPAVAKAVEVSEGDVILVPNTQEGRVLGGAIAAQHNAPIFTQVKKVTPTSVQVARYGGVSLYTFEYSSPVVLVVDGGADVDVASDVEISDGAYDATVTDVEKSEGSSSNLSTASRVVAVGRGFAKEEDLKLAEDFASTIGAEVASSRPLAEGLDWLPRDRYIGISGQTVKPDVYFAIGISGQMHHTVGMQDSGTVVVINSDEHALMFDMADYGIVGDLYEVLPALTKALA
ncbi:MAG: electron transfer flavoprotein subunit alpha/FixB family protein [Bifidobacteriaceae bacterium]|jgi:electron transfer flavoprotein alpha subunit|nr:electron transfer flavoprotein subunit alpha/FixB family protein [Bifidobacteriaceae bacterium]